MRKESATEKNITPAINATAAWRLTQVKPLKNYRLKVTFNDGTQGFVDMKQRIMSKNAGVFDDLKDATIFNQVHLVFGVATWPNGADLAPDAMYDEIKLHGKWVLK